MAQPDEGIFGTRRDRPVVVYPLRNDTDPDCDVLLIDSVTLEDPDAGVLGIIDGGRAVQVDMASDVDRLRFQYTISDGRGGRSSSHVTVTVVPDGQNKGPVLAREETVVVTGGTVTHNVLATAYDPDGDVLRLLRAEEQGTATGTVQDQQPGRHHLHRRQRARRCRGGVRGRRRAGRRGRPGSSPSPSSSAARTRRPSPTTTPRPPSSAGRSWSTSSTTTPTPTATPCRSSGRWRSRTPRSVGSPPRPRSG